MTLSTSLGRFRLIALLEGISFLVLLFIAMPMKYMMDMPEAVRTVGMLHGLLFVGYLLLLIPVKMDENWSFSLLMKSILVSLIPFGTFYADKKWWKK